MVGSPTSCRVPCLFTIRRQEHGKPQYEQQDVSSQEDIQRVYAQERVLANKGEVLLALQSEGCGDHLDESRVLRMVGVKTVEHRYCDPTRKEEQCRYSH